MAMQGSQNPELRSDHPREEDPDNNINRFFFKTYARQNLRDLSSALHPGRLFPSRPFYVPSSKLVAIPY